MVFHSYVSLPEGMAYIINISMENGWQRLIYESYHFMSQLTIKNTNINIAKIADLVQWFIYQ